MDILVKNQDIKDIISSINSKKNKETLKSLAETLSKLNNTVEDNSSTIAYHGNAIDLLVLTVDSMVKKMLEQNLTVTSLDDNHILSLYGKYYDLTESSHVITLDSGATIFNVYPRFQLSGDLQSNKTDIWFGGEYVDTMIYNGFTYKAVPCITIGANRNPIWVRFDDDTGTHTLKKNEILYGLAANGSPVSSYNFAIRNLITQPE